MHIKINTLGILTIGLLSFVLIFSSSAFAATTSKYLEEVTLPECDANNPEVQFIKTNTDWSTINNSSKRIFCVSPGDYRGAGKISLSAKGTSSSRRYIILNDGRETHPGKLQTSEQANVWLSFDGGGSYWTIDRMSAININSSSASVGQVYAFRNGATNNILNKLNFDDFIVAVSIYHLCHNNTIQKCRVSNQKLSARKSDKPALNVATAGVNNCQVHNTKFIQNEIHNTLDGIQLVIVNVTGTNYEGTIIDSNKIWQTSDIYYSTGYGTTLDPNGMYSWSENALDFKAASDNSSNPVIVTNNYMWGWRKQCASDGGGDPGTCVTIHNRMNNFIFENNIMFDSYSALESISPTNSMSIKNNIMYNCDKQPDTYNRDGVYLYYATNLKFENNTVINNNRGNGINLANNNSGLTFKNNLMINNNNVTGSTADVSGNYYYATSTSKYSGTEGGGATNANMGDLTFSYDIYTSNPKQKTLIGVLTTSSSPHAGISGAVLSAEVTLLPVVDESTPAVVEEKGPWIINDSTQELK